jgi:hypothetical protein
MRYLLLIAVSLAPLGCASEPPTEPTHVEADQSDHSVVADGDEPHAEEVVGECFGIVNSFSGTLSDEQERMVPEGLRDAFMIESLRQIKATDLAKKLKVRTQVAEETRENKRYVALRDYRCVHFSAELSGQMIVIERYVVALE